MLAKSPEETADQGNDRVTADAVPPLPEPPRKVGRPKGLPKTGGRTKGGKNWSNDELRKVLLNRSNATEVLADIVAGRPLLVGTERLSSETTPGKPVWRYPTIGQRLQALQVLLAKVLPDRRAEEVSGPNGGPQVVVKIDQDDAGLLFSASPERRRAAGLDRHGFPKDSPNYDPHSWDSDAPGSPPVPALAGDDDSVTSSPISSPIEPPARPGTFYRPSKAGFVLAPADYTGPTILLEEITSDARERWAAMDSKYGQVMRRCYSRADAEDHLTRLIEQRRI